MLCNAARDASSKTTNPIARRRFAESAKAIANGTAELVRKIKVCFYERLSSLVLDQLYKYDFL